MYSIIERKVAQFSNKPICYQFNLFDQLNWYLIRTEDDQQKEYCRAMIDFLVKGDNCFSRQNNYAHFTGSAWVVNSDNTKALVIHHKKLNMFLQVGGHADEDSNLLRVAYKETLEESGLNDVIVESPEIFDIDIHEIPEFKGIPKHYHYDVRFLFRSTNDELRLNEEEVNSISWMDKDNILNIDSSFGFSRMVKQWLNKN